MDRPSAFSRAPPPRARPHQYACSSARSTSNYARQPPFGSELESYPSNIQHTSGTFWSNDRSYQANYFSPTPRVETTSANLIQPTRANYETTNCMAMDPGHTHELVTHLTHPSHQPHLAGFHGYSDPHLLPIEGEHLEYIDDNGVRRYKCLIDGCTQRGGYKHKGCLTRHQKTKHVHPGSHVCLFCFRIFDRGDNLQAHMKRKHPQIQ